jgi:hypothetical protein|tara:strand:- start:358 stop:813 length:456 start_codon:yes stop_codon:yes gene_type:complete
MIDYKDRPEEYDYLKYYTVVHRYFRKKYELTREELDLILFLMSERIFNKRKFQEFNELLMWDRKRFDNMLDNGWISIFRAPSDGISARYELSYKARRMVRQLYKTIINKEIPQLPERNPMFKKEVGFSDKVYRNFIKKMNKETRTIRRKSK